MRRTLRISLPPNTHHSFSFLLPVECFSWTVCLDSPRSEGGEGERGGRQVADMATSGSLTKTISKKAPEVLPRASRARRFGIDCESELRWHAKEPGGDYKQKLLIKNVSNQVLCNVCTRVCLCVMLRACVPVAFACGPCAARGGATLASPEVRPRGGGTNPPHLGADARFATAGWPLERSLQSRRELTRKFGWEQSRHGSRVGIGELRPSCTGHVQSRV